MKKFTALFIATLIALSMVSCGSKPAEAPAASDAAAAPAEPGFSGSYLMGTGGATGNVVEMSLNGKIDVISIDREHPDALAKDYPFYSAFTPDTKKKTAS